MGDLICFLLFVLIVVFLFRAVHVFLVLVLGVMVIVCLSGMGWIKFKVGRFDSRIGPPPDWNQ